MYKLTKTLHGLTPHPDYLDDQDFIKYLKFGDLLCERVAKDFVAHSNEKKLDDSSVAIITTRMYLSGGHTSLVNDFVDALASSSSVTVYITGYWDEDTNIEELKIKYPGLHQAQFVKIYAWNQSFESSCAKLVNCLIDQMPSEVYLFQHPFDALAVTSSIAYKQSAEMTLQNNDYEEEGGKDSAESFIQPKFYFYHHADIRPTLGVGLKGFRYLAHKKSMADLQKENENGLSFHLPPKAPMVFQDLILREKNYSEYFDEGEKNSISIGQRLKFFPDFSNHISYADAVSVLLEKIDGKHIHIGPLSASDLIVIRESLHRNGVDSKRFIHIPFVYSLSLFLDKYEATFFLASFPIGGGLSVLEAMSKGLIVLPFNHENDAFSEHVFLPKKTPSWATLEELAELIDSYLKARSLKTKQKKFSDHFSKNYSREKFIDALETIRSKPAPKTPKSKHIQKTSEEVDYLVSIIDAVTLDESGAVARADIAKRIQDVDSIVTESPTIYFDDDYFRLFFLDDMDYWFSPILYYLRFGKGKEWNPHPLIDAKWMKKTQGLTDEINALSFFMLNSLEVDIQSHPIFDRAYYWDRSPDVELHLVEPIKHYLTHGLKEIPRAFFFLFDRRYFLQQRGSDSRKIPDLLQFLFEHDFDLSPHILFSEKYYRMESKLEPDQNAFEHYISQGLRQRFDPHPLISIDYLRGKYQRRMDSKKRLHNFLYEWRNVNQFMSPHPYFDVDYYVENDAALRSEGIHPIFHYLRKGERGNKRPHPNFSPKFYWGKYRSLVYTNSNLEHFILDGFVVGNQQTAHASRLKPYHVSLLKKALIEGDSENAVAIWETKLGSRPSLELDNSEVFQTVANLHPIPTDDKSAVVAITKHQGEYVFDKPSQLGWMEDIFQTRKMIENQVLVSKIRNKKIIGGSYGIYDDNGQFLHPLLCDYDLDQVDLRNGSPIKFGTKNKALLSVFDYSCVNLPRGIHLCSDYDMRGNSWPIDVLPKLIYLFSSGALKGNGPLIVDQHLSFQCVEAIRLFTNLPFKNIRQNYIYEVGELTYVSPIVQSKPFIGEEAVEDQFFTFNGEILLKARQLLSERLEPEDNNSTFDKVVLVKEPKEKIGNWNDFKGVISSAGYEIVNLAETPLKKLNSILKSANSIIALENECIGLAIMLAEPNTKIYIIRGENSYNNIYYWSNLGDLMDLSVHFLSLKEYGIGNRERGDEFHGRGFVSMTDCRNLINH